MRNLSSVLKHAIYRSGTERTAIVLHEITHRRLVTPLRFASGGGRVISNGIAYEPTPFRITLPTDTEGVPMGRLVIDNVHRQITEVIRSLATSPDFNFWVVLDDNPNRIEAGPWRMKLSNARYNALTVQMDIQGPSLLNEPYPSKTYNVLDYPALA